MEERRMLTLTGMVNWLNENFEKQTNTNFTISDIQSYIRRGYLPRYLGKYSIKRDMKIPEVKLYFVTKDE